MDSAQVTALSAVLASLPVNAFLILIIVMLWRRLLAVTDLLIDAKPMKTDDSSKLVSPAGPAVPPAAPTPPAAPAAPAPEVIRALPL